MKKTPAPKARGGPLLVSSAPFLFRPPGRPKTTIVPASELPQHSLKLDPKSGRLVIARRASK